MIIEHGKHVAVHYKLTGYEATENPEEKPEIEDIEVTQEGHPFEFIFGVGQLIPGFEMNIEGKQEGDTFDFTLAPAEAYGEYDDEKVIALPKHLFCDPKTGRFLSDLVKEGIEVPLQNQNGDIIQATVQKITKDEVVCDVNHPLAGMHLRFEGRVVAVREATEQDKIEYMRQMTGGGCGGHCGGCEDGYEGGCEGGCEGKHEGNCEGKHEGGCKGHGHGKEGCCKKHQ